MAKRTLEQRFVILEAQVEKLQEEVRAASAEGPQNWQRAIQLYGGDSDLQAVFAAAMKLREADRKRARRARRQRASSE